jgi:DNA-binding CsgD family transcriptional regulator
MNMLDPARIAQFFVMPGAVELVEAFSAIPPGPVRASIVAHAQALAHASAPPIQAWAAPAPPPEPMIQWRGEKPEPQTPLLGDRLSATSTEGQIIERALRGETPKRIADSLGIHVEVVYRLQAKARAEGQIVFPGDERGANISKASKFMRRVNGKMKVPKSGPWWWEDPASPVWDNPSLLPTVVDNSTRTIAFAGPMSSMNFKVLQAAANRHGMTLRQYVAQRYDIVQRVKSGVAPSQVARDLQISEHQVYGVLTQCGYTATQAAADYARSIVGLGARARVGGEA